ncbi:MAG: glucokinase, partial [Candidatus Electrothrix sp. AR3]|nr:glucokinase [Candidatus Electrothrix sp. AR3]
MSNDYAILAGDIGATKTALALYMATGKCLCQETYTNREFSKLEDVIKIFLAHQAKLPKRACFGVAGPVRKNQVQMTNLAWQVDGAALA